jgi:hypothetical protein
MPPKCVLKTTWMVFVTSALFIWLIIRLIQLVFLAGTIFFSHKKISQQCFFSRLIIPAEGHPMLSFVARKHMVICGIQNYSTRNGSLITVVNLCV